MTCYNNSGREYYCSNTFMLALYEQIVQYIWDYVPLLCILLFHKANFKDTIKNSEKVPTPLPSPQEEKNNQFIEVFVSQLFDQADTESSDNNEKFIRKEINTYLSTQNKHLRSQVSVSQSSELSQTEKSDSFVQASSINESSKLQRLSSLSANSEINQYGMGVFKPKQPSVVDLSYKERNLGSEF